MIKIKAVNVWPNTIDRIVFDRLEVWDYRGDVFVDERGLEVARIRVELHPTVPPERRPEVFDAIREAARRTTGLHFAVGEWDGPSLVKSEPGVNPDMLSKIKRWNDRRGETLRT